MKHFPSNLHNYCHL